MDISTKYNLGDFVYHDFHGETGPYKINGICVWDGGIEYSLLTDAAVKTVVPEDQCYLD